MLAKVTGDESGLIIDTFTVDGDGTAHYAMEETASTPSTKNRITPRHRDGGLLPHLAFGIVGCSGPASG